VKNWFLLMALFIAFGSSVAAPDNSRSRVPTAKEVAELLPIACAGSTINLEARSCTPCPDQLFEESRVFSSVLYGRFSSANETNAIMDMEGCEPHATNFGGTIVLRWKGLTRWEFVRYEPGERSGQCLKYAARAGHDLRVCRSYWGGMGFVIEDFGLRDDTRRGERGDHLVMITSNAFQCNDPKLNEFGVSSVERPDLNRDGRPDLRLRISERHARLPKPDECSDTIEWGPVRGLTLEFVFDGARFRPTPVTKSLVAYLEGFKA
jgi:hypothetical protein